MLKIGDFSKLSRISIRMLRHYDEIGLLKPAEVDPFTGYRYYGETQLLEAGRITTLRSMGFGLSMIGEILSKYSDPGEMERFLLLQRREVEQQRMALEERLRLIDSTITWLRKDGTLMNYEICVKTIPARYVASVRMTIPSYAGEGLLWQTLRQETSVLGMQDAEPSYPLVIYHDGEYKEQDVDVEAQLAVVGEYPDTEHVQFKTVPQVEAACARFRGGYEQTSLVNEALARWGWENGYELAGLMFNIYYVNPGDSQDPSQFVTEVCYPVKKK